MLDNEVSGIETLGVGIGFGVLEEREEEFSRLDGPAGLGDTELFACTRKKERYVSRLLPVFNKLYVQQFHPQILPTTPIESLDVPAIRLTKSSRISPLETTTSHLISQPVPITRRDALNLIQKHTIYKKRNRLTLRTMTSATSVSPHGDSLLVFEDILKERDGALQFPSVDGLGGFAGVLEADAEVRAARAGTLRARDGSFGVADLEE